ncbi:MAG: EVE domain-containing protein [Marinobacter sp.]|nr:EVE domain-containing protein [Marinobacter sp.]
MAYWLVKSEPDECSIDDFAREPQRPIRWDGVRNYQARNFLRDMSVGDQVLIYHSSCAQVGVAGIANVVSAAYPDPAQFDPDSPYHDPKSNPEEPRWSAVDLCFSRKFSAVIPLKQIKAEPALADMLLVSRSRLSVMPVSEAQWQQIISMSV